MKTIKQHFDDHFSNDIVYHLYKKSFFSGQKTLAGKRGISEYLSYHEELAKYVLGNGYVQELIDNPKGYSFVKYGAYIPTYVNRTTSIPKLGCDRINEAQIGVNLYINKNDNERIYSFGELLLYETPTTDNSKSEVQLGPIDLIIKRGNKLIVGEAKLISENESIISAAFQISSYYKSLQYDGNYLELYNNIGRRYGSVFGDNPGLKDIKKEIIVYNKQMEPGNLALANVLVKNLHKMPHTMEVLERLGIELFTYDYQIDGEFKKIFPKE